jgi:hypothetical protein
MLVVYGKGVGLKHVVALERHTQSEWMGRGRGTCQEGLAFSFAFYVFDTNRLAMIETASRALVTPANPICLSGSPKYNRVRNSVERV